ncbi:hypothetical protein RLT85_15020, partial [Mesonia ostreae]
MKYFQKYGKIKPSEVNSKRYVPFPELLFQDLNANIKGKSKKGFWLNLNGVYEYISYSEDRALNVENPESVKDSLSKFKEGIEEKLTQYIGEKQNEEDLKNALFKFSNLEKHIELFKRKDELLNFKIDNSLINLSEESFNLHLKTFKNKNTILKQYNSLQKEFEEFTIRKSLLEGYQKTIEKLKTNLFENEISVDAQLIKEKIASNNEYLEEQEESLKEKIFDEKLFLKTFTKEIITQQKQQLDHKKLITLVKDYREKVGSKT